MDGYLGRLGEARPIAPDLDGLRRLHRAHLTAVPFENSSVLWDEPIVLNPVSLVAKIVDEGRGGFCFELNGALAWLLTALGYSVELMPGRFWSDRGLGPPNEHLALRVTIDGQPWLVDVGAGFSFLEPLRLVIGVEQEEPNGWFRIVEAGDGQSLDVEWRRADGAYLPHYRFEPRPVVLGDFESICEFLRTSPDSPFTQDWICARALSDGWATLDGHRLVVTTRSSRIDETLDETGRQEALARWFSIRASLRERSEHAP
jgi:N-hydroxyarylamine O-acetyltransferase